MFIGVKLAFNTDRDLQELVEFVESSGLPIRRVDGDFVVRLAERRTKIAKQVTEPGPGQESLIASAWSLVERFGSGVEFVGETADGGAVRVRVVRSWIEFDGPQALRERIDTLIEELPAGTVTRWESEDDSWRAAPQDESA